MGFDFAFRVGVVELGACNELPRAKCWVFSAHWRSHFAIESALARGLLTHSLQTLTAQRMNDTNYPPASHRAPGDIRATSCRNPGRQSRNARATSSESAFRGRNQ